MKQNYHSNARTNLYLRNLIHNSRLSTEELSTQYSVSTKTITKWKRRKDFQDKRSRPSKVAYALDQAEQSIVCWLRKTTYWPLDEVVACIFGEKAYSKRSSVYKTQIRNGINKIPQKEKDKAKAFKEYDPGYLHIDVTYLPKIDGCKQYLFVAIDGRLPG